MTLVGQTDKIAEFEEALESKLHQQPARDLHLQQQRDVIRDAIHETALRVFDKRKKKTQDWFEANACVINSLVEEKRSAML